jgi:Secretory lipase
MNDDEDRFDGGGRQRNPSQRLQPRLHSAAWLTAGAVIVSVAVAACGRGPSRPTAAVTSTTTAASPATTAARPSGCVNMTQAPAASAGAAGPQLPTTDPFYKWRRSLAHDAPGTVLRTRRIAFAEGGASTPMKTTQLLYVTTDELGCRTVSVVTVFEPLGGQTSTPTRLFSYQTSYDALGAQCDPSYSLEAGTEGETGFIMSYVSSGYTVVMADYEGEDAAYGVGQQSGYETLDAIRAAENWLGVPEVSTPVGMLGYSGGAVATEFASELAPTYAPHLDIVGVAEGGIPVDLFHEIAYIDKSDSSWIGQIPSYLDGLARGFDIRDLDKYFTAQGMAAASADQTQCSGTFTGLTKEQLFKPQYRDIEKIAVFVRIFDDLLMSRSGTPRGPLFMGNGLSDSTGDGVTVTRDVQQLAYTYCHRGVQVEFHIYKGLDHDQAGTPFFDQAQAFLAQRFKNLPVKNGCAEISPGNSITPVPVPSP